MSCEIRDKIVDCFFKIAKVKPLVHQITNYVSANDQANLTLAIEEDSLLAALSGTSIMGICGELANQRSAGPASFRINFLDELYNLGRQEIIKRVKIEESSTPLR